MGRLKKTDEELQEEARQRKRKIDRKRLDLTCRNILEHILSVYLVGILPLGMHFLVSLFSPPQTDLRWVPAEAWLFVMVTSAATFGDAWQERRRNDGTVTLAIAVFGSAGTLLGALAYAILMLQPANAPAITGVLKAYVWLAVGIVAILYLAVRFPKLLESASDEAQRKVDEESKSTRTNGIKST
jgi:hypothetical protein